MSKSKQILFLHLIGCIAFLSVPVFTSPDFGLGIDLLGIAPFEKTFINYVLLLFFFYLNYYCLIPRFYFTNKKAIYILLITVYYVFIDRFPYYIVNHQYVYQFIRSLGIIIPFEGNHCFNSHLGAIIPFLSVLTLSFLIKKNNQLSQAFNDKLKSEVSYLKEQINPHFLFNTLNSIYALTLEKSNDAPKAVLKLSGMMRYVVTESNQEYVSLEKEINYVEDYIELQKLRMDEHIKFSYTRSGAFAGKKIAPLVLIPFIENAFKYGLNPDRDSDISIAITVENNLLSLIVKNKIVINELPPNLKTETGIENTQKRLDFMYPNRYTLKIINDSAVYTVHLTIDLS